MQGPNGQFVTLAQTGDAAEDRIAAKTHIMAHPDDEVRVGDTVWSGRAPQQSAFKHGPTMGEYLWFNRAFHG